MIACRVTNEYVGLDWNSGEIRERWQFPDDSRVWNAFGGITTILEDGDLMIGGAFAVKRLIDQPHRGLVTTRRTL